MPRLVAPNDTMKQVEIQGAQTGRTRTYTQGRDGTMSVENPKHVSALKSQGFHEAGVNLAVSSGRGFVCPECGRRGWFRKCGKCGCEDGQRE
jgi:hypothetical protein